MLCGICTSKTEPSPNTLLTFILPFIRLTSFLVIERPSPFPSIVWFSCSSTLSNGENILPMSSFLIPRPVSVTLKISIIFSKSILSHSTSRVIEPFCVYLTALFIIFIIICFIRSASPCKNIGISLDKSSLNLSPFSLIFSETKFIMSFTTNLRL